MDARAYTADDHQEVERWYLERGRNPVPIQCLPTHGAIVPGVCAAFLYKTDSSVAFIDALISNPYAPAFEVADGVESAVAMLTDVARSAKYRMLVFTAERPGVIRFGQRLGFRQVAAYGALMAKEI